MDKEYLYYPSSKPNKPKNAPKNQLFYGNRPENDEPIELKGNPLLFGNLFKRFKQEPS